MLEDKLLSLSWRLAECPGHSLVVQPEVLFPPGGAEGDRNPDGSKSTGGAYSLMNTFVILLNSLLIWFGL